MKFRQNFRPRSSKNINRKIIGGFFMGYYAGIDLGGTKVYAIITNEQGEIFLDQKQARQGQNC